MVIKVPNSQESKTIRLIGYGLERRLKINKINVKFDPILPNTTAIEENVVIENNNAYPIEVYWQHLSEYVAYLKLAILFL